METIKRGGCSVQHNKCGHKNDNSSSDQFDQERFLLLSNNISNLKKSTNVNSEVTKQERKVYRQRQNQIEQKMENQLASNAAQKNNEPSLSDSESQRSFLEDSKSQGSELSTDEVMQDYFEEDTGVEEFILQNHMGIWNYKLPKGNIRIHDTTYRASKYEYNMKQLVKNEIIADVNRRIEEKSEEPFQKQIKVELNYEEVKNKNTKKLETRLIMKAITDKTHQGYYFLEEFLIKGQRLGIISKEKRFKQEYLNENYHSTHLCFIYKDFKYDDPPIFIKGFEDNEVFQYYHGNVKVGTLKQNEYYYFDLESIISGKRQYQSAMNASEIPLIDTISRLSRVREKKKHLKERRKMLKANIINSLNKQCNASQRKAIKEIALKDAGIYLIQGPPGTGKTESIVNFVALEQYYYNYGEQSHNNNDSALGQKKQDKLMICAQSNSAINHIGRKILKQKNNGTKKWPSILRLGHTEQYDQMLLSINLPHLCQIKLRRTENKKDEWSAKLRWQKFVIQEKINKMMADERKNEAALKVERQKLYYKIKKLVEINEQLRDKRQIYSEIQDQLLQKSEIVLSTINTSGKTKFANFYKQRVRCLIIDEASQATQASALIPFHSNVLKVILVGDHMQLQPTVLSKNYAATRYNRSLFERLIDCGKVPYLLDTQYRMIPQLQEFPSHHFYHGKLKCGKKIQLPFSLANLTHKSMFFNVKYGKEDKIKKSFYNEAEVKCVKTLVSKILVYDKSLNIGIIAPYKCQIKQLQDEILKLGVSGLNKVKISTVDAFQGQEVDIIIISCVRSNQERSIGFVSDERRMNVAITRAKYALFVFGNVDTLSSNNIWSTFIDYHRHKQSLIAIDSPLQQEKKIRNSIQLQKNITKP